MKTICLVEYIDAWRADKEIEVADRKLPINEAFGWISETESDIVVSFAKNTFDQVYEGLVIPRGMLASKANQLDPKLAPLLRTGAETRIIWSDMVHFNKHFPQDKSVVVETTGYVSAIYSDHVVITNPDNRILSSGDKGSHLLQKAFCYRIPLGAILEVHPA